MGYKRNSGRNLIWFWGLHFFRLHFRGERHLNPETKDSVLVSIRLYLLKNLVLTPFRHVSELITNVCAHAYTRSYLQYYVWKRYHIHFKDGKAYLFDHGTMHDTTTSSTGPKASQLKLSCSYSRKTLKCKTEIAIQKRSREGTNHPGGEANSRDSTSSCILRALTWRTFAFVTYFSLDVCLRSRLGAE